MQNNLEQYTQRSDLTFKYNIDLGRHGWLRLTPAYSVKLVKNILSLVDRNKEILDPFCGTGTTPLTAIEKGIRATAFEINPFLTWFAKIKCKKYSEDELKLIKENALKIYPIALERYERLNWYPKIFNIERWWSDKTLLSLTALRSAIVEIFGDVHDKTDESNLTFGLVWIAFCRLIILTSTAAFNHVSMSFSDIKNNFSIQDVCNLFINILNAIIESCKNEIEGHAEILNIDSTICDFKEKTFDVVITSPPYANRISYIRELRPYMYWTKFLKKKNDAGELDWRTIGGTWGIATSNLNSWHCETNFLDSRYLEKIDAIANSKNKNASVLAKYVLKYFYDMNSHIKNLTKILNNNCELHYIVGNSCFFGIDIPTHEILSDLFRKNGYNHISHAIVRKRNCNKALFEYEIKCLWG